jgi:hypothetical protein
MRWNRGYLLSVVEFFSLRNAEHEVEHLSIARRIYLRSQANGAVALMRAADRLTQPSERLGLATQAIMKLAAAVHGSLERECLDAELSSVEATVEFLLGLPKLQPHREAIGQLCATHPSGLRAATKHAQLRQLFGELERMLDTRTPREFMLARIARASVVALGVLGMLWLLVTPKNVALGRDIFASSISNETPEEPLGHPRLYRVVDGTSREHFFALATELQVKPWVTVDLGKVRRITKVVVYGRSARYFGAGLPPEERPLTISISTDQKKYESILTRKEPIVSDLPWSVELYGSEARYVRLSSLDPSPKRVVVSEIEVYGR